MGLVLSFRVKSKPSLDWSDTIGSLSIVRHYRALSDSGFLIPPSAFHQLQNRSPAVAPDANTNTAKGLLVSTATEQPAVE